jgi:hypothetical protein
MDWTKLPLEPHHLGVPSSVSKTISMPMVRSVQTVHLSCTNANTISKQIKIRFHGTQRHLGVPSGASNTIFELTVCLTQTVHQSCIKSSTISKQTELNLHLSLITKESHQVRPKQFLCLWYIQGKPWTNVALTLTLSPNGLKRDFTRPTSLKRSIGCVQNYLWANGKFSANRAPILRQD